MTKNLTGNYSEKKKKKKKKKKTKKKEKKKKKKPYKMTHDSGGFHFFLWPTMAICRILRLYTLATKELDSSLSPIFF